MKPYGQKKKWAESDMATNSSRRKNKRGGKRKNTKLWKKRARRISPSPEI